MASWVGRVGWRNAAIEGEGGIRTEVIVRSRGWVSKREAGPFAPAPREEVTLTPRGAGGDQRALPASALPLSATLTDICHFGVMDRVSERRKGEYGRIGDGCRDRLSYCSAAWTDATRRLRMREGAATISRNRERQNLTLKCQRSSSDALEINQCERISTSSLSLTPGEPGRVFPRNRQRLPARCRTRSDGRPLRPPAIPNQWPVLQNGQTARMSIRAVLRTERGEEVRFLPDPAGGEFDAAGDFDALLPQASTLPRPPPPDFFKLLRYVDPYGDTIFNQSQMGDLLEDIDRATARAVMAVERRGLDRLRVIAERCRDGVHLYVWFIGD